MDQKEDVELPTFVGKCRRCSKKMALHTADSVGWCSAECLTLDVASDNLDSAFEDLERRRLEN